MKKTAILPFGIVLLLFGQTKPKIEYPPAPKSDQVDDYHGTPIADPYRTLENADAASTQRWVQEENKLTFSYLAKLPGRDRIKKQLTELWDYEKFGLFSKAGSRYFYAHNTGLQNQAVMFTLISLNGQPRELLDPNSYRKDGTTALSGTAPSWNGKLFGYAIAQAGSDWKEWRVRDVESGRDFADTVNWSKSDSISWAYDDGGFYYERFPEPAPEKLLTVAAENQKIYFHKLGDPQSADQLVYQQPEHPSWEASARLLDEGRYLMLIKTSSAGINNMLSYQDLKAGKPRTIDLIPTEEYSNRPIASVGTMLYLQTNDKAPRGKVVRIDLTHPERANWREIVPEREQTLDSVRIADGKMLLAYMQDAHSVARLVTLAGKPIAEVIMPGIGSANWSEARTSDQELFYRFDSFAEPPALYRLDLETGKSEMIRRSKLAVDVSSFETKQVFYNSKDGTRVPMFVSYKKGMKLDGQNPTLLYGYGGFDIALTPYFTPAVLQWLRMGGVYVSANLRGGSEYGEAWHKDGMLAKKQNVFDDFIAGAEWLIKNKYTSKPKLAVFGHSNGGLLVGAVLNQRPELFGAAMPAVGVMDMLRFHKFGYGMSWAEEYGNPDNAADFTVIARYSPLHNIRQGTQYPPTLITTSDHDDRVMTGHSLKYAATMQHAQVGPAPILLRVEKRAGHGAGNPTSNQIEEWTDRLVFLESSLGMAPE